MTNRTQQVQIGNVLSDKCPVKYGVPQGPSNFFQAECCNCSELKVKYTSSF
jgi:hypothetical protein